MCIVTLAACSAAPAPAPQPAAEKPVEPTKAPATQAPEPTQVPAPTAPPPTAAPEKVTVRVFTRWSDASPASQAFRDRLAEFAKLNPTVTIQDESINDEASFNDKWKAFVATEDIPDVFQNYGGAQNADYVENDLFADLTPDFAADQAWKAGFLDLFANWQYAEKPGTYGVPYEFYAVGLFYNKDLLDKVGAQPPQTVDEFAAVSDKLLSAGIIPMAVGEKDNFKGDHLFTSLGLKKYGPDFFKNLASGAWKFDGPEALDVLTLMADWNNKGYLGENIVGVDYNAEKTLFLDGKSAMHFDGSWFLGEAEASPIKDKIGVVSFPSYSDKAENQDTWMGGAGAGLSINGALTGAQRDAAIALLKFVTSMDHFKYIQTATKGGAYPAKLESDPAVVGPVTIAYVDAVNTAKVFDTGTNAFKNEVVAQLRDSIQGMFAGNTPEKAAAEIAEKAGQ
jgi:raffinose/stachyose/melibiose transport system substrate-binding protein